ncbi:redox-regulated ATPase YchF [Patescibacteria group bacterium]|nr:redox-regulated ATPase YchF [Patescibacteria group bacterium]MBU1563485.1 redox-regulated ATPase YchF [Patescibacteria group bacterium]
MPLSIGIVGLPNVGKSTLFQTLTKKQIDRANYPFCTIDPNVGVVTVPDERVDQLAELTKSAKKIYTTIEFIDIAGLVKGANKGEGLGNKFLANIRETDAILYILRIFKNDNIINTQDQIDPIGAKEILDTEMALKDLATLEKVLKSKDLKEIKAVEKAKNLLQTENLLVGNISEQEKEILKQYQLLTLKPRLYLLNGNEKELISEVKEKFEKNNWPYLLIDTLNEFEMSELAEEEKKDLGISSKDSGLDSLIKKAYQLLDLITFLTTGSDETRAWTIKRGGLAPQAGGVIHTDFEKNFIKADVINWQDLIKVGGTAQAREKGLIRIEGKEYVVQDGDVIEIKHGA